jgi:glycerol kinase
MHTGDKMYASTKGLLTTIVASDDNKINYALEGSVFVAGATMQWLRDEMKLLKNTAESMDYALKVKDNGGVYFVPAFTGLACPYWDPYAKGTVVGITRGTSKVHFIRAALESIAFQSNDVIQTMIATVYKGNIIKNLIMDCQSYTKYRPNETTGGIFVSWRRKEELPTGA